MIRRATLVVLATLSAVAGAGTPATGPTTMPAAGDEVLTAQFVKIERTTIGMALTIRLTNVSGKRIDAVKGAVAFVDRFGDRIGTFNAGVAVDKPIAAGASVDEQGIWSMLDARVYSLLENDPQHVTLRWKTAKVAYAE